MSGCEPRPPHSAAAPVKQRRLQQEAEHAGRRRQPGASICLIKFDKGTSIPEPHMHASNLFMFCLQGHYEYTRTGVTLKPGSLYSELFTPIAPSACFAPMRQLRT